MPRCRSLSNCAACHTRADSGSYAEREIVIPGRGPLGRRLRPQKRGRTASFLHNSGFQKAKQMRLSGRALPVHYYRTDCCQSAICPSPYPAQDMGQPPNAFQWLTMAQNRSAVRSASYKAECACEPSHSMPALGRAGQHGLAVSQSAQGGGVEGAECVERVFLCPVLSTAALISPDQRRCVD